MVMMLNGDPLHIPLAEFDTQAACEERREAVMRHMAQVYPPAESSQTRYYCERRPTAEASE